MCTLRLLLRAALLKIAAATLMKMVAPIMAIYVDTAPKLRLPKNMSRKWWNRRLTGCCRTIK